MKRTFTQEHKTKLSLAKQGKPSWNKGKPSPWTAERNRTSKGRTPWNKGKTGIFSEETIEKIRKSSTGKPSSRKGKKLEPLSETHRKNISESLKGEKCYNWKGGITKENLAIRASLEYRLWRESVFKRDNFTCVWCGDKNGKGKSVVLNADHIKRFADYPELRFAIDNGRTLCKPCHLTTYGNR